MYWFWMMLMWFNFNYYPPSLLPELDISDD